MAALAGSGGERFGLGAARRDPGYAVLALLFLLLLPLSTPRVALSDEVQYYAYLRSLYFDRDLDFRNEYQHFAEIGLANGDPAVFNALLRDRPHDPPVNPATGKLRNVAPVGAAIMWAPGFALADVLVRLANLFGAGVPADGYAAPYIWAACFMSALYALLGLLLTYRLARRFAGVFAATLASATVFLASPLVFYTFIAMPWSHATGFFLFALFLTLWLAVEPASLAALPLRMVEPGPPAGGRRGRSFAGAGSAPLRTPGYYGPARFSDREWGAAARVAQPLGARRAARPLWAWALLGLAGGLMVMTREQLGLLLLLPAVEGLVAYGRLARERRWDAAARLLAGHLLFLAVLAAALAPQFAAYQILNGRPGPSATVAQKLGLASPNFFNTLIDPAHGAFLWAPVLPLGLLGLFWLAGRDGLLAFLLGLAFVAQTYVNGAFGTTWHLSGSFGFRRLIECTPIFVIGLAALCDWLRFKVGPWPLLLAALLLVYWNVGLIAQWTVVRAPAFRKGLIWDEMLRYQFVEVPRQVVGRLYALLFDRCSLVRNC